MNRFTTFLARDKDFTVLAITTIVVTFALYMLLGQRVFSLAGVQSMSIQVSEFGLLAIAMGLAMLTGGIDLSIVAAAGLAGVMASLAMSGQIIPVTEDNSGMLFVLGVVVALVTGLLTGLLNGLIIAKLSVPPILATLGTMILFTGIGMAITTGNSVGILVGGFSDIAALAIGPAPLVFVMLIVVFVAVGLTLTKTRFGRRIYLFGENDVALRFSGARTERTIIFTYMLIGIIVGLAAIVIIARANSMRVGFGESYLLQTILAVVLAGFNPFGGKGRIVSLGFALVLLQTLSTSMTAFGFSPYAKNLIWGLMLLLVMVVTYYVNRPRARGRHPRDMSGGLVAPTGTFPTVRSKAGAR
ncbi:ABC transporter permease [Microbacterium sp. SSW1-59]|uniref:ABC transporter permease n=1 Tax=Microbacterium xanthum TaxID=3079794 RepID=UPI002AD2F77E|nr:ABC transporter permease [Microbacterium sp. SSW1-59]MDZ8201322.1 ABC transporter permease [Microbacterium sp. SSW1-59]